MRRSELKSTEQGKIYQKIPEACRTTGLSQYMLRRGCRNGTVPCVRSGRTYYVDVPGLLEKLSANRADDSNDRSV